MPRLNLLLPKHELCGVLDDPMGGCKVQELNHVVEVVSKLLVAQSTVIDTPDPALQLLHDLIIPHSVGISTDALPLWVHQVAVPSLGCQECGEVPGLLVVWH